MAHVRWHATIRFSWFLGLIQHPDASQAIPYACPGSRRVTCQSLRRGSLLTIPTIPYTCPGSQCFTNKILTPVQAPNNSNNCLHQGSLATAPTLPYAGAGTQCFTPKSLCLCRFPTIQKKFLMPGKASNNSHANPYACTGSQRFTTTSLCLYRFPKFQTIPYAWAASQQF
ncbi:hypothetical protein O181_054030 [Austropuccinia psidii MF-1]|uniref:Uncharacterized protein n=1 Tax=Austropuccinia psidii MF-1 TaxID=1389203 RepID=A0A9Q3HU07_9BASI|nr:hypothetical protein [Austropuccinia psidii MF-1]